MALTPLSLGAAALLALSLSSPAIAGDHRVHDGPRHEWSADMKQVEMNEPAQTRQSDETAKAERRRKLREDIEEFHRDPRTQRAIELRKEAAKHRCNRIHCSREDATWDVDAEQAPASGWRSRK